MCVAPLAARHVENSRASRQREHVDETRDLVPVALLGEDGLILEQIVGVEIGLPPVGCRRLVELI
jgi:hypothetical protein